MGNKNVYQVIVRMECIQSEIVLTTTSVSKAKSVLKKLNEYVKSKEGYRVAEYTVSDDYWSNHLCIEKYSVADDLWDWYLDLNISAHSIATKDCVVNVVADFIKDMEYEGIDY